MDKLIFQPIEIRGMKVKNRIAMPPFLGAPRAADGSINDKTIRWFGAKAAGGTGLIMTGLVNASASEKARGARLALCLHDDSYIPGFARLAEVIHSHGAKLGVQIGVPGPAFNGPSFSPPPWPDEQHAVPIVAEAMEGSKMAPIRVVSVEDLQQFEQDLATAAVRAKAAGADCVELHCAHGGGATLHCNSISPFYNRRTDEYGGSWQNRLRFPTETIKKIREAVGESFPILVRINGDEFLGSKGITLEVITQIVVPALEEAGVDCFDVSQGSIVHTPEGIIIPLFYPRGCFIHHAAAVKKVTNRPVIGVGRIIDPDMAERFLQEGKADIIYMGGQLTADPEFPKKYFEGRADDIRYCMGCRHSCIECAQNYDMEHIQDEPIPLVPAAKPKKVMVIGGGVGGMEAARIATLRGHKVTLMEKDSELGGMVAALALNPLTADFRNSVDFLTTQLKKLKVDVRVCKEVTEADVDELKPDVVILATGSSMVIPEVAQGKPGVMHHIEALRRKREIGNRVVIWGLVACELAITLAQEGRKVTLMGRGGEDTLARDHRGSRRLWLFRKLTDIRAARATPEAARISNVEVLYYVDVEDITSEGIRVVDREGRKRVLPYDTFIISRERRSNDSLFNELQGKVAEVYKIGDCAQVKEIKDAIWSANEVARKI